jgi:Fe-S cluster assembly iron-binding protein IscA
MISVTEAAKERLNGLLEDNAAPEEVAVRLFVKDETLTMGLDNSRPGDQAFDHGERTVLLIEEPLSTALSERTLDVEETKEGPLLALK